MHKHLAHEKIRFLLVGTGNTTLDFLLFNIFALGMGLDLLIANTAAVIICITASYFLNRYFVFSDKRIPSIKQFLLFMLITGFSSIVIQGFVISTFEMITASSFGRSLLVVSALSAERAVEINIAKAAAVAVGLVWNFMFYKYLIFRPNRLTFFKVRSPATELAQP